MKNNYQNMNTHMFVSTVYFYIYIIRATVNKQNILDKNNIQNLLQY